MGSVPSKGTLRTLFHLCATISGQLEGRSRHQRAEIWFSDPLFQCILAERNCSCVRIISKIIFTMGGQRQTRRHCLFCRVAKTRIFKPEVFLNSEIRPTDGRILYFPEQNYSLYIVAADFTPDMDLRTPTATIHLLHNLRRELLYLRCEMMPLLFSNTSVD